MTQLNTLPAAVGEPQLGLASTPAAGATDLSATLDRYGIAVVMNPIYEWGGYRYGNSVDAIAAAKRAAR